MDYLISDELQSQYDSEVAIKGRDLDIAAYCSINRGEDGKPRATGVFMLIDDNDRILVTKSPSFTQYELPQGGVKCVDGVFRSLTECTERELRTELNEKQIIEQLSDIRYDIHTPITITNGREETALYKKSKRYYPVAARYHGTGSFTPDAAQIESYQWMTKDEFLKYLTDNETDPKAKPEKINLFRDIIEDGFKKLKKAS